MNPDSMVDNTKQKQAASMVRERLNLVIVGHVDHGKSTLVGRLLADTGSLPEGKLEALREHCERNARPLEYAFLLDALKDEQSQGITIDSARCFFKTSRRDYIIIDAPGHIEFLKNMVSGAARADAAVLVIDANEGVRENSRRHGYFLSMLGIGRFVVCVNKMDLANYSRSVFEGIKAEYSAFLSQISLQPDVFIPVSAYAGENVIARSNAMPWYDGPSLLDAIEAFQAPAPDQAMPLRMPVQDVYKFTALGDDRRILAGRIESGSLRAGDPVVFLPSNKMAAIKSFEAFNAVAPARALPGESVGVTLDEELYITRGEIMARRDEPLPKVSSRFKVDLFWLGRSNMTMEATYKLKLLCAEEQVRLEKVERVLDASSLDPTADRLEVRRHEVARCILRLRKPIAAEESLKNQKTGRFVIVDQHVIAGGGIIVEVLPDEDAQLRQAAQVRDSKWVRSPISPELRSERYAQRPALVLITGPRGVGRKTLARALEQHLFHLGRFVYYLGMGSVVYGLGADIKQAEQIDQEHDASPEYVRRLGEMLHVLLDAGLIVICTAADLSARSLRDVATIVAPVRMLPVRILPQDAMANQAGYNDDLRLPAPCDTARAIPVILAQLKARRIIADL